MPLFTDFMQTLTAWLHLHPDLALLITFLVSLSESFAIVGSIVPGSITMTAVGVLAGSGIMRIDLTLLAAILGAIAGDGASYVFGYACRDRLAEIWPFRRYPNWLKSGKEYFTRHGRKSVLIGRFVGPLRSIIPVIAGMMGMNRWHFLLANVISAIGWALLYVMPGVLIGAASTELSTEDTTKLFVGILLILVLAWLTSLGIIKLIIRANMWLAHRLHITWAKLKHQRAYYGLFKFLTPRHEKNHYRTAMLPILLSLCFLSSILLMLASQTSFITHINKSIYLFLQTIHTPFFDAIFIVMSFMIKPLSIYCIFIACGLYTIYVLNWRMLAYWSSLFVSAIIIVFLLKTTLIAPFSASFIQREPVLVISTMGLIITTALLTFLIFYFHKQLPHKVTYTMQIVLSVFLIMVGFSSLYLGDNLFSNVLLALLIGLTITLVHWIFYRRVTDKRKPKFLLIMMLGIFLTLSIFELYIFNFNATIKVHQPKVEQYIVNEEVWWSQQAPLLPAYSTSRTGQRNGVFNIQYSGSLNTLKNRLAQYGWKSQSDSFLNNMIQRVEGQSAAKQLPLITQLHLNKKPALNMVYYTTPNHKLFILRLWRSNYYLNGSNAPIWLGNIIAPTTYHQSNSFAIFKPLMPAIKSFQTKAIAFSDKYTLSKHPVLLIKEAS